MGDSELVIDQSGNEGQGKQKKKSSNKEDFLFRNKTERKGKQRRDQKLSGQKNLWLKEKN